MTERESSLILPGDPRFMETLGTTLPVGFEQTRDRLNGDIAYVVRHDQGGLIESVTLKEATDYMYGGEWDLVEEQNEEYEQEYFTNVPDWLA